MRLDTQTGNGGNIDGRVAMSAGTGRLWLQNIEIKQKKSLSDSSVLTDTCACIRATLHLPIFKRQKPRDERCGTRRQQSRERRERAELCRKREMVPLVVASSFHTQILLFQI